MRKVISVAVILVLFLTVSFGVSVNAKDDSGNETANDLFELYNEATIEELSKLQEEYNKAKLQYESAVRDTLSAEQYNSAYEKAEEYQQMKLTEIDEAVQEVLDKNRLIADEIDKSILGDWDTLRNLDLQYKTNLSKIETLLDKKNDYELASTRVVDYESLDELGQEIEDLETKYQAAEEVFILGDVTNVKYPLGAETVVTSKFGNRIDPITKSSIRFHAGIDLRAATGTEVLALFNGTVVGTGYGALGGYYVRIDHGNGIVSYYCHLSQIKCKVGQKVNQYDVIALSGNTGSRTTGPHLHLGLYINGNPVDPGVLFE